MNLLFEIGCYLIGGGILSMFIGSLAKMNWEGGSNDWWWCFLPVGFINCIGGVVCILVWAIKEWVR